MGNNIEPFAYGSDPGVGGFLHRPAEPNGDALVLTHGAGSNCQSPLLRMLADTLAPLGYLVLRCDLPFRQLRPFRPPQPGDAARDRQGLIQAVAALSTEVRGRIFLGGHSYGGRQSTIVAAEHPRLVAGLLLASYPLHPPGKSSQLRTAHLPSLRTPALFVHGTRDPFGSLEEMREALNLIPAETRLLTVEDAGHDLNFGRRSVHKKEELSDSIREGFLQFFKFKG